MNPFLKELGFGANDRVLILHADDLGMCAATVEAFEAIVDFGLVRSGSAMVPCPWFPSMAQMAQTQDLDLGLHLTLNSEHPYYRWRPLAKDTDTLVDRLGYFHPRETTTWESGSVDEIFSECHAQLQHARDLGMEPTHLDSHMFTLMHPALLPHLVAMGHREGVPTLLPAQDMEDCFTYDGPTVDRIQEWRKEGLLVIDRVTYLPLGDPHDRLARAQAVIEALPPGLSFLIAHPATDTTELREAAPADWRARVEDFKLFTNPLFSRWIKNTDIHIMDFRSMKSTSRT